MLSRAGAVVVMATSMTLGVHAGDIRIDSWPTRGPQDGSEITLPVTMDIGSYVVISPATIRLEQTGTRIYEGCCFLRVECNFRLALASSIIPTVAVKGQYSCSLAHSDVDPPGGTVKLCARLSEAEWRNRPPQRNVTVAIVKLTVVPR